MFSVLETPFFKLCAMAALTMPPHHWMGVYLHAAFELFVGINFIVDPGALLDEHKPASAFEYHAWECFGISCAFWGLVLMLKANDRTVLALDVVWNTTWMAVLWTMMQGQPWREESRIDNAAEWALVPLAAHGAFAAISLIACFSPPKDSPGSGKKTD